MNDATRLGCKDNVRKSTYAGVKGGLYFYFYWTYKSLAKTKTKQGRGMKINETKHEQGLEEDTFSAPNICMVEAGCFAKLSKLPA